MPTCSLFFLLFCMPTVPIHYKGNVVWQFRILQYLATHSLKTVQLVHLNFFILLLSNNIFIFIMIKILFLILFVSFTSSYEYDKAFSQFLDKYSAITHCTEDQIINWTCKLCQETQKPQDIAYIYNQQFNILAFLGYVQSINSIMISWRGTVDIKNWIQDFTFLQVPYQKCTQCEIHEGFFLSFISVKNKLFLSIQELIEKYPNAKIVITGSSLGGALAIVSSLQIQEKFGRVSQLHVFGAPRVGNQPYAYFINLKIPNVFRVIHNRDIVPHVPEVAQKFYHPTTQILFDEQMNKYKVCSSQQGQDPDCSDRFTPNYSIPDHVTYWSKPIVEDVCTL